MHPTLTLLLITVTLLSGCINASYESMAERRLAFARTNEGDIHIAAIRDLRNSGFLNGVLLAAQEVNNRPGKLMGRNLQVHIEQGGANFEASKSTIRRIANNPKITAVLGHRSSSTSIPASVIYERSQVIFMPPFATSKKLTNYHFRYVFRMMPGNTIMAEQLASVAETLGYKKVVLLHTRDDFSREQTFLVEDAIINHGLEVVGRASFFSGSENYRPIIAEFNNKEFDGIFIASPPDAAGRMVNQLREMGVNHPVLGSDSLNHPSYLEAAGIRAENTIIPDIFPPRRHSSAAAEQFIKRYEDAYDAKPDFNAAQGYDSLMLLASAIERAEATIPSLLSTTLHFMPAWVGITGIHAFTKQGDMRGKKYLFKVMQQNQWRHMPAIESAYTLERFQKILPASATNFVDAFADKLHDNGYKLLLLDLAHEILHFKRMGLIYEDSDTGRESTHYELVKALAERRNFEVIECKISPSRLASNQVRQAITDCYGKLSLTIDALLAPQFHGLDEDLMGHLNRNLSFYKIPTIALDNINPGPNLSLVLGKRPDINLRTQKGLQVYQSLLKNLRVHEFAVRLKNLPDLTIDLKQLQAYGISDEESLLLSPDHYVE